MTKRRPVLVAALALTALAGGLVAASSVGAQRVDSMVARSTTTKVPTTTPKCYGGPNCTPRTKNAALPSTIPPKTVTTPPVPPKPPTPTTSPKTVTTPAPTVNTMKTKNAALPQTKLRTKNAALPTTTVAPTGKGKGKGTVNIPVSGG